MISVLDQNFSQFNLTLNSLSPSKIFILTDENTHQDCLPVLLGNMETTTPFEIIEIDAGEEMKTIETASQICEILAEFNADRQSVLINLGGGVITDLGGFAASVYKRGIRFINIPTSLLGMCDASIGGKTGVDLNHLKNMMGTFAMPEQIFLFPDFLKTLPFVELRSGFAEMLKHGLIADATHWKDLTANTELNKEWVSKCIARSMEIKQQVTEKDFKETGLRKVLNFGHTIGHAVESVYLQAGNPIPHGEAVAVGMICETHLSCLENKISVETSQQIISVIRHFFPKIAVNQFDLDRIFRMMQNDKKNSSDQINFTLLSDIGNAEVDIYPSKENVLKSLAYYKYN